ncbi:MAG: efflux RND transporter periplasmic adaptor subunit [Planctomycetota bacterium]
MPLDAATKNNIGLRSEPIEMRWLAREIRTIGEFAADETREKVVSAWVDGRIDKLYANYTGVPVEKGWHLFDLYSPKLYSAQKELIVARRSFDENSDNAESLRLLNSAREKMRLLGLTDGQVSLIEELDEPQLKVTIPSPDVGIVTKKYAHEGMYVKQGQPIFRITDLSRLWLLVDIHERDIGFVALGQSVEISVNALPGRQFTGSIGFIHPQLDTTTRTIKVRVEVENAKGLLKPGMLSEATIFAPLGKDGAVAMPELNGNFACPMHPLQRSMDPNAECDICGMEMAPHEHEQGIAPRKLWAVPRSAVLSTGDRTFIYIEWWARELGHDKHDPEESPPLEILEQPDYQGFPVKLGPLAAEFHVMPDGTRHKLGEYYPLLGGLPTGMRMPNREVAFRIVINGQFLIDSQMELTGKPSLFNREGGAPVDPHAGHKKE